MAMFSAYFDESTGKGSPLLVVGGFLSSDAQWSLFETEWNAVLKEFKISAFHMQHFALNKKEFRGMKEATRRKLMAALLEIIQKRAKFGFASVVHVKEFNNVFRGKERSRIGSVYNLGCTASHLQVGEWAKENYQIEPIAYFFDAGHRTVQR